MVPFAGPAVRREMGGAPGDLLDREVWFAIIEHTVSYWSAGKNGMIIE